MIDCEKIKEDLLTAYRNGRNLKAVARARNISYGYLHELLSGKRSFDGLTIKKFNQIYPDAVCHLHGDSVKIDSQENHGNVVGINHGSVNCDCRSWAIDKILAAEELTAEVKVQVMKVLQK